MNNMNTLEANEKTQNINKEVEILWKEVEYRRKEQMEILEMKIQ